VEEQKKSVKTTRGADAKMREVYLLMRDFEGDSMKYPATIWGEQCAKDIKIGDVIMVLNAKQALFQQKLRFNIGDAASITLLTKAPCVRSFTKWAKNVIQAEQIDLTLELPPGLKLWKGT
jgi:ssDNA-binding replication factor A large subunit